MRVETCHPAEDYLLKHLIPPARRVGRCPHCAQVLPAPHKTSILPKQAQALVPAPSQTHLPPIPSLTPVHAEVALGADGLDEAVRPVVKGMAISCGQLDPGPESGKGSQCCLYPLCSSRATREAKDCQRRDLSQACPVIFPFQQIQGCRSRDQRWKLHPHPC